MGSVVQLERRSVRLAVFEDAASHLALIVGDDGTIHRWHAGMDLPGELIGQLDPKVAKTFVMEHRARIIASDREVDFARDTRERLAEIDQWDDFFRLMEERYPAKSFDELPDPFGHRGGPRA